MSIKTDLNQLTTEDTYSLLLFALYKLTDKPDYAALSQLAYILDKDSLLKLCSFYGGRTVTLPTIEELNQMLESLLLYYKVKFENFDIQQYAGSDSLGEKRAVLAGYDVLQKLLQDYKFDRG